jgi:hypothetical protein
MRFSSEIPASDIAIHLSVNANNLIFNVADSRFLRHDQAMSPDSGIGLENVRKRLELSINMN